VTSADDVWRAVHVIEQALFGDEPRRGVWTDRDYLVHALAILTDSNRASTAASARPKATHPANKPVKHKDEPWWWQYENTATTLEADADYIEHKVTSARAYLPANHAVNLRLAADDIRTLVDGLRDYERKAGESKSPDPAVK